MSHSRYRGNRARTLGAYQDDLCFFCEQPLLYVTADHNDPLKASFDHYVSRHRGGAGTRENTVVAHRQCNSEKGHEPSPEFDDKLAALNIKRGYGDSEGRVSDDRIFRMMRPGDIGSPSIESLNYLCILANEVEGEDGVRLRDVLAKRIQSHALLLKALSGITNLGLRGEAITAIRAGRKEQEVPLEYPFSSVLDNVIKTMTKLHFVKEKQKQKKKNK